MFFGQPLVPSIDAAAVPADAHVLDVREPEEWAYGHIEGAQHIPLGELAWRVAEVPADSEVYVVCKVGGRSAQAVQYLNAQGRKAVNVDGGMLAWVEAGRPMVSETGYPPMVV